MLCLVRDYNEGKGEWVWAREAPPSQKVPGGGDAVKKLKKKVRVLVIKLPCDSHPTANSTVICCGVLQDKELLPAGS